MPPLPLPPLTALKRRDTSTCPLWMSLGPRISARPWLSDVRRGRAIRPSRAEPLLHLLDTLTRQLDKRLWRCTPWLCLPGQDASQGGGRSGCSFTQGPEERETPLSPDLIRIGRIESVHVWHDATPSRSTKDPGPRSPRIRCLKSPPDQPGRKRRGPESRFRWTTPQAVFNVPLVILFSAGCRGKCVIGSPRVLFSARASNRCDSSQIKHVHFQKENKYIFCLP